MNKLESINLFFINDLKYLQNLNHNQYKNIGFILIGKIKLSQILYKKRIITRPKYQLFVDKDSYESKREKYLKYIIEEVIILPIQLGKSKSTIETNIRHIFSFFEWIDNQNINLSDNIVDIANIYRQYTTFLRFSIRNNKITNRNAHVKQVVVLKMFKNIYNDNKNFIPLGTDIIVEKKSNGIQKSNNEYKEYNIKFYHQFFKQITNFLINDDKYPHTLDLPSGKHWLLPSTSFFVPNPRKSENPVFDHNKGRTLTIDEIKIKFNITQTWKAKQKLTQFENTLRNNQRKYSANRLNIGLLALKSYYIYFLSLTGMNDSTAATLKWDDYYEIEKVSLKLKNIKYRAGNKNVEFLLQNKALKDFKLFLELRKYLLKNKTFKYLFFNIKKGKPILNKRYRSGSLSSDINNYFKNSIDTKIAIINSRQLRVDKIQKVIEQNGIITASQLAQNTINTVLKSYVNESEDNTNTQLTSFFDLLNKSIIINKNIPSTETQIGHCKDKSQPLSIIDVKNFESNCKQSEGCLFCKQYACHADELDARKILNLLFIIKECQYIAKDKHHFETNYSMVISRANDILKQIQNINNTIDLEEIKNDIYENENLLPYWEHKYNTLVDMGVLI